MEPDKIGTQLDHGLKKREVSVRLVQKWPMVEEQAAIWRRLGSIKK